MLVVGCGESQQSAPQAEAKPVVKAPDISLLDAASAGQIGVVKLHLAAGTDVNVKTVSFSTPLHYAASGGHKEIVVRLIAEGADVHAKDDRGRTPLDVAEEAEHTELADLLRKHGGKTGEELKAEGK